MRPHPKLAETDPTAPRAWGTCDRTGFVTNHHKLIWQFQWAGLQLQNTRVLVAEPYLDIPNRQLGANIVPPDPMPVFNARPENYTMDEQTYRVEEDGSQRYTMDGVARIQSNVQSGSAQ